jgi:carboxylesterase type B
LRFQKPQANLEPWHTPLNATRPGAACPGGSQTLEGQQVNEDCLYLDIFFDEPCTVSLKDL